MESSSSPSLYEVMDGNSTSPCTNHYCLSPEDYLNEVVKYILPTDFEWVLIALYIVVFIVGILGNLLVCVVVCVEKWMRTTTNLFIVNLSLADFMVLLFCLPTSVLADVTETWYIGRAMCKIVVYLQGVSVSVSVLTLSAISVERYYAICHPLLFQTTVRRTKLIISTIWMMSFVAVLPELIVLDVHETLPSELTILLTRCSPSWDDSHQFVYQLFIVVFLFCLPVVLMGVAYSRIAYRLWGETDNSTSLGDNLRDRHWSRRGQNVHDSQRQLDSHQNQPRTPTKVDDFKLKRFEQNVQPVENYEIDKIHSEVRVMNAITSSETSNSTEKLELKAGDFSISKVQVLSRRKVAKMLICVVIMFVVCYLPVHILNILRYWKDVLKGQRATEFALIAHFLCYFNSAVNPVIYNFMSGH